LVSVPTKRLNPNKSDNLGLNICEIELEAAHNLPIHNPLLQIKNPEVIAEKLELEKQVDSQSEHKLCNNETIRMSWLKDAGNPNGWKSHGPSSK
jgi:hypothetical protein